MEEQISVPELAKMIDHSLLHPTMTDAMIAQGCALARRYRVATACVKPYATAQAAALLSGSGVGVCTVVGFPHGNSTPAIKVAETMQALADGASEIDMVVNIGKALSGEWGYVAGEVRAVNTVTTASGGLLKVIFETDYLQDEQVIHLCEICSEAGVAFVKTSTGYGFVRQVSGDYNYQGATDHNLRLMRQHSAAGVQIKAAGGVRTLDDLLRVRALGVRRVGATATAAILDEAQARGFVDA